MNDVNINCDNVKVLEEEILELVNDYSDVVKKLKEEVEDIQESNIWNGVDNTKFNETSDKYLVQIHKTIKNLNFYSDFIKQSRLIYETLENDYYSRRDYE